jgi:hypothetical protein
MTTRRTIACLHANDRQTNGNQPAIGVDKLDTGRGWPGRVGAKGVCNDDNEEKEDVGMLSMS